MFIHSLSCSAEASEDPALSELERCGSAFVHSSGVSLPGALTIPSCTSVGQWCVTSWQSSARVRRLTSSDSPAIPTEPTAGRFSKIGDSEITEYCWRSCEACSYSASNPAGALLVSGARMSNGA